MAGSSIYHLNPISADTNAGTGAMTGASQSFSHAGTVFGELRKSILDEEQRKIENDYKERQFAEAIRQFGLTDARANRIAAETERHNKATEEYQLKNLAETSRYHTASLAAQKAYHDAIIGARNKRTDLQYGAGFNPLGKEYQSYLFGDSTPSTDNAGKGRQAVAPSAGYTPSERAMATMSGDELANFALNDLGGVSIAPRAIDNPLLGGGAFFNGLPTPDMNVGDMANLNALPLEERMDALRRMSPAQQMELDMEAARQSGANPFGGVIPAPESAQTPVQAPVQVSETPAPVQIADKGSLDRLGDFLVTPVHAETLPQQTSQRGPETFYKASPIGLPTAKDLEISKSNYTPMDLADIDRRNTPIPISQQAKDAIAKARQNISSAQPQEIPWWRADTGGGELRNAMNTSQGIRNREMQLNNKTPEQAIIDVLQGGKPKATMRGGTMFYETPMQKEIRERDEAAARKADNPNVMFNVNRYSYDYTTDNEDYALENLHPTYQSAVRSYLTDFFSAEYTTRMGNGAENANRASIIGDKELRALKNMAELGDVGKDYATGMIKNIIARRPELMAKGRRAIAYLNDFYDNRFSTSEGRVALDTHYRAESGDDKAIAQQNEIYKERKKLGEAQRAKDNKINSFLANPARFAKNYAKVDSREQNLLEEAARKYLDTQDFRSGDEAALNALAFAMTIDNMPVNRRLGEEASYLMLDSRFLSKLLLRNGAESINLDANDEFSRTFRRNLLSLQREHLTGKALESRLLSFIGYDKDKDKNK